MHEEEKYDIYLTGSNAFLLSSDLATLFRGRVFEIKVFPFSFKEYVKYYETNDIDKSFDDYFKNGGMSGSYLYRNSQDALKYIEGIVKTTIVRDIVDDETYHLLLDEVQKVDDFESVLNGFLHIYNLDIYVTY